jgi:hypothetical protein
MSNKLNIGDQNDRQEAQLRLNQTIQEVGRLINSLKPLIAKTAAVNPVLQNLVQGVRERISEINNWARMMKADSEDQASMIQRTLDLSRAFVNLQQYLKIDSFSSGVEGLIKIADLLDKVGAQDLADHIDNIIETIPYCKDDSLYNMAELANHLDSFGAYELADMITANALLIKKAYVPIGIKNQKEEELPPIQPRNEGSLSTRYCPDHRGVQAVRVSEGAFQCPIDGKVYNHETGYVNYQGQTVPGGSVAEQTPKSSDCGGIPMRIYDGHQNVLNYMN